jgi:hypothetical protein
VFLRKFGTYAQNYKIYKGPLGDHNLNWRCHETPKIYIDKACVPGLNVGHATGTLDFRLTSPWNISTS